MTRQEQAAFALLLLQWHVAEKMPQSETVEQCGYIGNDYKEGESFFNKGSSSILMVFLDENRQNI